MYQHVIQYLIREYNYLEDFTVYLAMKPEAGGYRGKDWRSRLDEIRNRKQITRNKIIDYELVMGKDSRPARPFPQ